MLHTASYEVPSPYIAISRDIIRALIRGGRMQNGDYSLSRSRRLQ